AGVAGRRAIDSEGLAQGTVAEDRRFGDRGFWTAAVSDEAEYVGGRAQLAERRDLRQDLGEEPLGNRHRIAVGVDVASEWRVTWARVARVMHRRSRHGTSRGRRTGQSPRRIAG